MSRQEHIVYNFHRETTLLDMLLLVKDYLNTKVPDPETLAELYGFISAEDDDDEGLYVITLLVPPITVQGTSPLR